MADRKSYLSPSRQKLVTEMQRINYGRIENLSICRGDPVFDPKPRVTREIKFGNDNGPRPEAGKINFPLKTQVYELFDFMEALGDGVIECIEIQRGLPFRMIMQEVPA